MSPMEKMVATQEISELLFRRARASDRGDLELALDCYHPGATELHAEFEGEAAEFLRTASFTRVHDDCPVTAMMHMVTNILPEFQDESHAFVESLHLAYCAMRDGTDATIGGRYLDRIEKRDGQWKLAHREVIFDWSRMEEPTAKFWASHPALPILYGKRGVEDRLYHFIKPGV